jgi:serine protease inhibitor
MYGQRTEIEQIIKNNRSSKYLHIPTIYAANHFNYYFQLFFSQLGMKDMFHQEMADFSGITGSRDLYVSHVLQKAFVEVTELGTEAGASSGKSVSKHCQFVVQLKVYDYMKSADLLPLQTDLTSKNCIYDISVPNTPTFDIYNFRTSPL